MVGVPLECERSGGVSGEGLEVAYRLAALCEQGEARVPEIVEADRGESRAREKWLKVTVHDILGIEGTTGHIAENEAVILPQRASGEPFLSLPRAVASEGFHGPPRQSYGAA